MDRGSHGARAEPPLLLTITSTVNAAGIIHYCYILTVQ